ncbi:MAG: hypothetical protein AVDCRST_MAG01-01-2761 [uncultured Rubrobacteraceae bacterium]|uniref:Uncharacterized protein n=1 Tax=uncultured Rubrobacteraceae bacterium TaxID=349277 RepID=A0A6J4Q2X9_9ACTN|nr:MAG: hypothetical protein AVDCRST_MAG01-01-2761 [uncultured Rubrobacteraceae bacterium]
MESSAHTHPPSTSKRSRRGQDPVLILREDRALGGHVEQAKGPLARSYEGCFELPVAMVLAVMWVAGAALVGSCALALYLLGSSLLQILN